jgi:hypothetical protein
MKRELGKDGDARSDLGIPGVAYYDVRVVHSGNPQLRRKFRNVAAVANFR